MMLQIDGIWLQLSSITVSVMSQLTNSLQAAKSMDLQCLITQHLYAGLISVAQSPKCDLQQKSSVCHHQLAHQICHG